MRILMVANRYLPIIGGAERQLAALAPALQKAGHPVTIVTRRITRDLPERETINTVPVNRIHPIGLGKIANILIIPCLIVYLLQQRKQYDIIHTHGIGPIGLASIIAGRLVRKPVLLKAPSVGDLARQEPKKVISGYSRFIRRYILPQPVWRQILKGASGIVTMSQTIVDEARAEGFGQLTVMLPNGVDTTQFHPVDRAGKRRLREKLGLSEDSTMVITSGRLIASKRLDVLIAALPPIVKNHPSVHLYIAGSGSHQTDNIEEQLHQQVAELKIQNHVTFLGLVHNIGEYLKAADLFVFPSETEGMPNALLEAMACGLPIIASDIEGVRNVTTDDCALLVPSGSIDLLTTAITQLLESQRSDSLGMNAFRHIKNHYAIEAVAQQYISLYESLIKQNGKPQ